MKKFILILTAMFSLVSAQAGTKELVIRVSKLDEAAAIEAYLDTINSVAQDPKALAKLVDEVETFVNYPDNPYFSEEQYIAFLTAYTQCSKIDEKDRLGGTLKRLNAMKNCRQGVVAPDFNYLDRNGKKCSLKKTEAPQLLLVMFNPDCDHCRESINELSTNKVVKQAMSSKGMKVLAVYSDGEKELWEDAKKLVPTSWIVGFDTTGVEDTWSYFLHDFPTYFVLDSSQTIVFKTLKESELIDFLGR